eukprot:2491737-Amphidinium_carterae.1
MKVHRRTTISLVRAQEYDLSACKGFAQLFTKLSAKDILKTMQKSSRHHLDSRSVFGDML